VVKISINKKSQNTFAEKYTTSSFYAIYADDAYNTNNAGVTKIHKNFQAMLIISSLSVVQGSVTDCNKKNSSSNKTEHLYKVCIGYALQSSHK